MGGMHDGGVSALPPHRRRALSGPQREWLVFWPCSLRARAPARARTFAERDIFPLQLGGLNPACLSSLHHGPSNGAFPHPRFALLRARVSALWEHRLTLPRSLYYR